MLYELGNIKLYSNNSYDIEFENIGSQDLIITGVVNSDNVKVRYITTPVLVPISGTYNIEGFVKATQAYDTTDEFVMLETAYYDSTELDATMVIGDPIIYNFHYNGIAENKYSKLLNFTDFNFIKNVLMVYIEFNDEPDGLEVLFKKYDDTPVNELGQIYHIGKLKKVFTFTESVEISLTDLTLALFSNLADISIKSIKLRSY